MALIHDKKPKIKNNKAIIPMEIVVSLLVRLDTVFTVVALIPYLDFWFPTFSIFPGPKFLHDFLIIAYMSIRWVYFQLLARTQSNITQLYQQCTLMTTNNIRI